MANKRRIRTPLSRDDQRVDDAVDNYTRLILALSFICIVTRTFDTAMSIFNRVRVVKGITASNEVDALLRLIRRLSYLLIFAEHGLDVCMYYFSDSTFKGFFRRNSES